MSKRTRSSLLAATAVVAVLGLGAASAVTVAHAQGWGDGPGFMQQGGGCGGGGHRGHGMGRNQMGGNQMGGNQMGGGRMLAMMDGDADGTVTRAEFDTFHALAFKAMDPDGDGAVERQAFIDSRQPPAGAQQGQGRQAEMRGEMRAERLGTRFDMWDADKNGTVLAAEFESIANAHFAAMDLDGDNSVTRQELDAKRMFGPRGPMGH